MAFVHPMSSPAHAEPASQRRHPSRHKFIADLSQCLFEFVVQLLPTQEEMVVKEDVRKLLERLIRTIEPDSRLLSFGSTANGFSLRNSDMDLCCLIDSEERLSATDLVTMLGDLLERETKFHVKPLPHARIPIVKLSLDPSPGLPLGIACDIGFENRLALENTRLLMCYAMIDPQRVRTLVLFLKVWSKRRKINSPYKGTLSSYGYVLLVIYFLIHVKNPPVLPNLQQMPPLRPISKEETQINGYNTWFFDDIDLLRQRWRSENTEPVGQLLVDFFRYYSRDFLYNTGIASIRAGLLKKESKGWQNDLSAGRYHDARERNRMCIEDPFETDYNVARCVTKDGLYTIRGEFMRASRVLASRPERAVQALALLCEERKDDGLMSAPSHGAPRLSNPPPQTPFPVGSQSMRANRAPPPGHLSPPKAQRIEPISETPLSKSAERPVPEHMAPKRSKWTSPPPPEAPLADHALFRAQLDKSLELATAPTEAREKETCNSPSSNSEAYTDEERSDATESDITSVRSFTEGTNVADDPPSIRRPSWHLQDTATRTPETHHSTSGNVILSDLLPSLPPRYATAFGRNRFPSQRLQQDGLPSPSSSRPDPLRWQMLSNSTNLQGTTTPSSRSSPSSMSSRSPASIPLPTSPDKLTPTNLSNDSSTTVYYQTAGSPGIALYPGFTSGSSHTDTQHNAFVQHLHQHQRVQQFYRNNVPQDIFPSNMPPAITSTANHYDGATSSIQAALHKYRTSDTSRSSTGGHDTPTPILQDQRREAEHNQRPHSFTTVTAPTPPHSPAIGPSTRIPVRSHSNSPSTVFETSNQHSGASPRLPSLLHSVSSSPRIRSQSPFSSLSPHKQAPHTPVRSPSLLVNRGSTIISPQPSTPAISNGSSPALSSTGTGYDSSLSRSPSPRSPRSPPPTAIPIRRAGGKEEGEDERGRTFESFAALHIRPQALQSMRRRLVTDDPAVLEVSPPVGSPRPAEKCTQ